MVQEGEIDDFPGPFPPKGITTALFLKPRKAFAGPL